MAGVQIAVNAISDTRLLVDSSDCAMSFAETIQNHDLNSTLISTTGHHRVFHTGADVHKMTGDRTVEIESAIARIAPGAAAVYITPSPVTAVTGVQYDMLIRRLCDAISTPMLEVRRKGLIGDWLDGYEAVLTATAGAYNHDGSSPDPSIAAVVGILMDRNEQDCIADIAQIRSMLSEGLGLQVSSLWPDGGPFSGLMELKNTGTVISLPYGRKAAAILAKKLGANLVVTDLPMGIDGTCRWLRDIAAATGTQSRAEDYIDSQLSSLIPQLKWIPKKWLSNARIAFCGDPYQMDGIRGIVEEMDGEFICGAIFASDDKCGDESLAGRYAIGDREFRNEITGGALSEITLFITNSIAAREIRAADTHAGIMEYGLPSYAHHELYPAPRLGFGGAAHVIGRIANGIAGRRL